MVLQLSMQHLTRKVAKVSKKGKVKAVKKGKATIKITVTSGGKTYTLYHVVKVK